MSTVVLLEVTVRGVVDPEREVLAPPDVLRALAAAGQPTRHGLSRQGRGPLRLQFQLSGPDRVSVGQVLQAKLRELGYEADTTFWR